MPLTLDVNDQPKTLEEAIDRIVDSLDDTEKEYIRDTGHAAIHHGPGTNIRNGWNLWAAQKDNPTTLHDAIKEKYGTEWSLCPGDDISGMIFEGVEAKLKGEEFDPQVYVDRVATFYKKQRRG